MYNVEQAESYRLRLLYVGSGWMKEKAIKRGK